MYTSTVQSGTSSANAALPPHPCLQISYPLRPILYLLSLPPTTVPCSRLSFYASCLLSPDSLRVLQWNAGGLQASSTKLLHLLSSHPVDLIYIQEYNLNSASSFRISGFSALRSDCTHSRSGILSRDATHASGGVIIFVRQGLSFSELSTSSLSLLDPYSDYVGVNISTTTPCCHFLMCTPPYSLFSDGWQNRLLFSILQKSLHSGDFNCHHPLWDSRGTSDPCGEEVFDWVISFDLLPLNDPDKPTFLHRSSGSRSSPDISFAIFISRPILVLGGASGPGF